MHSEVLQLITLFCVCQIGCVQLLDHQISMGSSLRQLFMQ